MLPCATYDVGNSIRKNVYVIDFHVLACSSCPSSTVGIPWDQRYERLALKTRHEVLSTEELQWAPVGNPTFIFMSWIKPVSSLVNLQINTLIGKHWKTVFKSRFYNHCPVSTSQIQFIRVFKFLNQEATGAPKGLFGSLFLSCLFMVQRLGGTSDTKVLTVTSRVRIESQQQSKANFSCQVTVCSYSTCTVCVVQYGGIGRWFLIGTTFASLN